MKLLLRFLFIHIFIFFLAACAGDGGGSENGNDGGIGGSENGNDDELNNINLPVFTSPQNVAVEENNTIAYTATATDADGDALTFSLTGGLDQTLFSLGAMTGVLSFNTAPSFEAPADSDGNNTYIIEITVTDGVHQVSQSITVNVEPEPTITLSIDRPSGNQPVETEIYVTADVQSDFDISIVTASVESNSTNLIFSSDAICVRSLCRPGFGGTLSLSGLAPGVHDLTVTVEDVLGSIVSEQRSITLDNKPTITINEPIQFSVARPNLPLDISCTDDLGDCEIAMGGATGTNALSGTLDLSTHDGSEINLSVTATDSSNQVTTKNRIIYVETSTNLVPVKDFTGQIIDFDGTRALILTSGGNGDSLSIQSITSDVVTDVEVLPNLIVSPTRSFLSPTGVIYTTKEVGGNVLTSRIYDWNNSNLRDLGHPDSSYSLTVSGDYAIWSEGQTLWLRQFSTETNTQVSTSAGNWYNSVASNGVVGYWGGAYPDSSVVRYEAGVHETLVSDTAYSNSWVVTDGSGFVYRKVDRCCSDLQYSITFHDGISELALTNFRDQEPIPPRGYQINNGWIAFTDLGGLGQTHVWTRDPLGILLQRTVFGSNSYIEGLSSDGEVMLINNSERHHSNAVGLLNSVNSTLGRSINISGTWFVFIGRSLFEVSL